MLPAFELLEPGSLDEALAMLAESGGTPLAGGTNLFPDLRARGEANGRFISLSEIAELRHIDHSDGKVVVGAATTLGDILHDSAMKAAAPALVAAAEVFAGSMVRNAATVGGNLCYGSPSADLVPPLLSLDAEVTLTSTRGKRTVPLNAFYLDYKKTVMQSDELLTSVSWMVPEADAANLFYKLGRRRGDAITVTGVAVTLATKGDRCTSVKIALGSVAPTVFRATGAEAMLAGETLSDELIDGAARKAAAECNPIDDIRASEHYRRLTVHALVRRLLTQAWKQTA